MEVMTGVPTCFRARCFEAAHDFRDGYWGAGRMLAGHMGANLAGCDDERVAKLEELGGLIRITDVDARDEAVWAWFKREFPACMRLVPRRRRATFLAGVYLVEFEEGIAI